MVIINNLTKRLHDNSGAEELFSGFSLNVPIGTVMVLLGESGCGKSTLLRILVGAEEFQSGSILLDSKTPAAACAAGLVGFAEQDPTILPWQTTIQNILLPFKLKKTVLNEKEAGRLIDMVGLSERSKMRAGKLSGGEKKRLAFARAFVDASQIILLDEPFSSCDLKTRFRMYDVLVAFYNDYIWNTKRTLILVTHSIEEAALLGMRAAILRGGRPCTLLEEVPLNEQPLPSSAMFTGEAFNDLFERNVKNLRDRCLKGWA